MAITYAGISVEICEVELKNKPEQLLAISTKRDGVCTPSQRFGVAASCTHGETRITAVI